jgi:hypothetical protein
MSRALTTPLAMNYTNVTVKRALTALIDRNCIIVCMRIKGPQVLVYRNYTDVSIRFKALTASIDRNYTNVSERVKGHHSFVYLGTIY